MKNIKVVIGSNFGDEGKGLMVDYFTGTSHDLNKKSIVVKFNGGAQAGHTVETETVKHVFHHFGSGTFQNAETYLSDHFYLNPMFFKKEYFRLQELGYRPNCTISPDATLTTPFDIIINQIIEESRGIHRHGSCGLGIFETFKRNQTNPLYIKDANSNFELFSKNLKEIRQYAFQRLKEANLEKELKDNLTLFYDEEILEQYLLDLHFMLENTKIKHMDYIFNFDNIIFEGAQGLLLDQFNQEYFPHLTPSSTGTYNIIKYIEKYELKQKLSEFKVEIIYVTRTYFTRHGAGLLKTECKKECINEHMLDETNIPNPFQHTLRYGYFDLETFSEYTKKDFQQFIEVIPNAIYSIALTHLNETNEKIITTTGNLELKQLPGLKYISFGKTRKETKVF